MSFFGAAGTVTGSCTRIQSGKNAVLVDIGLFQGSKTVREENYRPFAFDPAALDGVLLTHAHIDHSGLLPKLFRFGFRGPVYATAGTADLLEPMLRDSAAIQEMEVERFNRRNRRRGREVVEPIYRRHDVEAVLTQVRRVFWEQPLPLAGGMQATFWPAGHILGSASISLEVPVAGGLPALRLLFSGDIGPGDHPFHQGPQAPAGVDYLILESTYGDREREAPEPAGRQALLLAEIRAALAAGGNLIIPAFAVERSQELLYDLDILFDTGALPAIPVFLDSPLAIAATRIFDQHLPAVNQPGTPHPFHRSNVRYVGSVEESIGLNRIRGGAIIMAASGMCEAGRIRHHLANALWRPETTVLLVGYQAPGTLGRLLLEGEKRVRIHGEEIAVRARIRSLDIYSGHADRTRLLAWAAARRPVRLGMILNHGEESARQRLQEGLVAAGFPPEHLILPQQGARYALTHRGVVEKDPGRALADPGLESEGVYSGEDWHNSYARTLLRLGETVRNLPDDAARSGLLTKIHHLLDRIEGHRV